MRLKDFYADPRRAASDEVDFGASWRGQGTGPWRVVWLRQTGELVAFNVAALQGWEPMGSGGDTGFVVEAMVAGIVGLFRRGARDARRRGQLDQVVVLGVSHDAGALRRALVGWAEHEGDERGLEWLTGRLEQVCGPGG